jgi:2-dehydro-3-deoxyphosphogluconate aldolase / (4S)-4-hydroxy-2-oxoglutarate aldolase
MSLSAETIQSTIGEIGVVPVITLTDPIQAAPLGEALVAGDVPVAEVTFRSDAAAKGIELMRAEIPDLLVGAGTVLTVDQADAALAAGAQFVVTPGFNPRVVDHCLQKGVPIFPGVNAAAQIEAALERGLTVVKFFPAEASGGVQMLKALSAPYRGVKFMPTGGVSLANLLEYLALPSVVACGGSWLAPKAALAAGDYAAITEIARATVRRIVGLTVTDRVLEIAPGSPARAAAYLTRKGIAGGEAGVLSGEFRVRLTDAL